MYPYIVIGDLHIASYSLMVLLGAIAFTAVTIVLLERREGVASSVTNRILLLSILGFAALGVFAFLFNSLFHSLAQGRLRLGGITWLGGVLGAFPLMLILIHKLCPQVKGEAVRYFHLLIPGITLAHAFGRVGCFLGGCCYGAPTESIFGVAFPAGSSAALQYPADAGASVPVLPTQLFEAAFELLLFIVMIAAYRRLKSYFAVTYAFSYGIFRFILELLRGDDRGKTGIGLTPSQVMSIVLIIGGVCLLLYQKNIILKGVHARMERYREERQRYGYFLSGKAARTLREMKLLAEEGVISQEEFEQKKQEYLKT